MPHRPLEYKLLVDENVSLDLVKLLQKSGFDAVSSAKGLKNGALAALAVGQSRILLTHDRDFLRFPASKSCGIVFLSFHPPLESTMLEALKGLFKKFSPAKFNKRLLILSDKGFEFK